METDIQQVLRLTYQMIEMGLSGIHLHKELTTQIAEGSNQFQIATLGKIDDEQFKVELSYKKDPGDGAIQLDNIKACKRSLMPIYHTGEGNVGTFELEREIKDMDWFAFFKGELKDWEMIGKHNKILNQLAELAAGNNQGGKEMQEKLMFKYWISDFISSGTDAISNDWFAHERQKIFIPGKDSFTVQLAANIFSGKLGDIFEKVLLTNVERYDGTLLMERLNQILTKSPSAFDLVRWYSDPYGTARVNFSISLSDGYYNIDSTNIDYKSFRNISVTKLDEITDQALENLMASINWNTENTSGANRKDKYSNEIMGVFQAIEKINAEKNEIEYSPADLPTLKFWLGTPFEDQIRQSAWNLLENLPSINRTFFNEIEIPIAINLMSGRPVAAEFVQLPQINSGEWVRLDEPVDTKKDPVETLKRITDFTRDQIGILLKMLPISKPRHKAIIELLLQGYRADVELSNGRQISLESYPEIKDLKVYDTGALECINSIKSYCERLPHLLSPPQQNNIKSDQDNARQRNIGKRL